MTTKPPNLMFSHMGISVTDLAKMETFYTQVLGFTVTDRGQAAGLDIVFLSRDPLDHHQIVLATGRPMQMPANTCNPLFGPCINQISFRMPTLADLRDMHGRLRAVGYRDEDMLVGNHGISWSIYVPDPEKNMLELFVDTEWYILQPLLIPLDFSKTDEEINALTERLCRQSPGFEPIAQWRERTGGRMTRYRPPSVQT
jgi:catechol-2,3-dioxygenase